MRWGSGEYLKGAGLARIEDLTVYDSTSMRGLV